ncbi:hypothetical protein Pelo_6352 [Pelomyxa schiedti]|nr:hypothetical protein Pelo_6352 [Pelomyxa schiedti]
MKLALAPIFLNWLLMYKVCEYLEGLIKQKSPHGGGYIAFLTKEISTFTPGYLKESLKHVGKNITYIETHTSIIPLL